MPIDSRAIPNQRTGWGCFEKLDKARLSVNKAVRVFALSADKNNAATLLHAIRACPVQLFEQHPINPQLWSHHIEATNWRGQDREFDVFVMYCANGQLN